MYIDAAAAEVGLYLHLKDVRWHKRVGCKDIPGIVYALQTGHGSFVRELVANLTIGSSEAQSGPQWNNGRQ